MSLPLQNVVCLRGKHTQTLSTEIISKIFLLLPSHLQDHETKIYWGQIKHASTKGEACQLIMMHKIRRYNANCLGESFVKATFSAFAQHYAINFVFIHQVYYQRPLSTSESHLELQKPTEIFYDFIKTR